MRYSARQIQLRLKELQYYNGRIDGIIGPLTNEAIILFKEDNNLFGSPNVGPLTLAKLFDSDPATAHVVINDIPWLNEINKHMGLHEVRNKQKLIDWLVSDGRLLGDPSVLPWCGDAIETAIKIALPNEKFTGSVKINPYLARNWLDFGVESEARFGSIAVFSRPGSATSGHVCFLVAYDPQMNRYRCRGGNQQDSVSDTWIAANRLLGCRVPSSWKKHLPALPRMNSKGQVISKNEA